MNNANRFGVGLLLALALALSSHVLAAAPNSEGDIGAQMRALAWQPGPLKGNLGDKATLQVPADGAMLPQGDGSRFLELNGNLPNPRASVVAAKNWFSVFSFIPEGYVKDDEKVDPDALMKELLATQEAGNKEREKRGFPKMYIDGWYVPPHYDKASNRLEWGTRLHVAGSSEPIINYTVRILGRSGHESATLVSDPTHLDADVKDFKKVLASFEFNAGEKYSEFKPGDKVAAYGLGALVVGGAAAVATKTGFWKVLLATLVAGWKFVAAAVVALVVGIGKFFGSRSKS